MTWRERLADFLFGGVIEARVQNAVKVIDDQWWTQVGGSTAPNDLNWTDRQQDLSDALDAWRANPMARQIVRLTRGFVLQDGISFRAGNARLQRFVDEFWNHRQNRMTARLRQWCDALTLNGEIFPVLFLNAADGMSYVRTIPAKRINEIDTVEGDYESEIRYHELTGDLEGRWWYHEPQDGDERQTEMLHFAVNKPEGATRGSGDLDPILPWLRRYKEWLLDRVIINKGKSKFVWDLQVEGADRKELLKRKAEVEAATQSAGGYFVHNEKEKLKAEFVGIAADSAEADGRQLRLMVAAGAGVSLHHFGESDSANRASSASSDRAMLSHYRTRQSEMVEFCVELLDCVAHRAQSAGRLSIPRAGLRLEPVIQELTKEDNLMLAQAAREIVSALADAKAQGWVDDQTAMALMFKFAGEIVDVEQVLEKRQAEGDPIPVEEM